MWRNHFLPASLYDVPAIQAWLEDQAKRGKLLDYWCVFRKGEPTECQYRLEPVGEKEYKPSEEKEAAYEAAGWEFVCATSVNTEGFFVWRSVRPNPEELHTEPETEGICYEWLQKRWWGGDSWLWVALTVLPLRLSAILSEPVRALGWGAALCHPAVLGQLLLLALFLGMAVWRACIDRRALKRLRLSLSSGVPMPRRGKYGYLRWCHLALLLLLLLNIVMPLLLLDAYVELQEIAVLNRWEELGWI